MTNDIKQTLIEKIAELKAEIAVIKIDWEAANAAYEGSPTDPVEHLEYFMANYDALTVYQNHKEIADYEETLTMDLVQVTTRYVITDGDLISPAGFHPSTGVYVKNDVWIETDRLPQMLSGLKAFDLQKDKEAA